MRRRAFTIIELLVIVGIIVVLVAILIPTLGAVYAKGYKTRTQALMNELQGALATYYAQYHVYPGGTGSGAQNLLACLSGGPDTSVTNPDGSHPTLPAFFNIVQPGGGKTANISAGASAVIIDAYSDSLPILYYRRTPGATLAAAKDTTTPAAYYLSDNIGYTNNNALMPMDPTTGTNRSSATPYDQTTGGLSGASAVTYLTNLVVSNPSPSGMTTMPASPQVHGGYMLLDAGADRIYGTSDDVVIVAGD